MSKIDIDLTTGNSYLVCQCDYKSQILKEFVAHLLLRHDIASENLAIKVIKDENRV